MAAPAKTRKATEVLARNLGANVYRHRVLIVPKPSQQALARAAGLADETIRNIENSRNPDYPPYNASLEVVNRAS
jgi:hypothetical protein